MAFEPPQYPRDLASVLLKRIEEHSTNGLIDRSVAPIPTHREIETLLDVTFIASLLEEEGRRAQKDRTGVPKKIHCEVKIYKGS